MASSYAVRSTPAETFSKITVSCWFKGRADGTQRNFWGLYDNSSSNRFFALYYSSNGSLYGYWKQNEGTFFTLGTTQKFRDPNAWYHFVMTMDTTLSTAADRVKFYVNGERVTSFEDSLDTITQNATCNLMNGTTDGRMQWGGGKVSGTQYYWNGSMSHCHMCVGYAYDASSFGSTDSTTGEWKINTDPSVSYGTNGGWWFKDGSQLTDSSTNSNTLTSSGTLTNTEDCPSNVFCTLNPLYNQTGGQGVVLANGNTRSSYSPDSSRSSFGTIAVGTGKFYYEAKLNTAGTAPVIGVVDLAWPDINGASGYGYHDNALNFGYNSSGQKTSGGTNTSYGDSWTAGDIIGVAIDKTNNKLYFAKNGVWQNSGDPTSGSTGYTGSAFDLASDTLYTSACRMRNGGDWSFNFGNGYFGTTAITSEGTNASNIGKFEYDVPTGYTALSTNGLNE